MYLINEFINLFSESSNIQLDERSFVFELEFNIRLFFMRPNEDILKIINKFPARDRVEILFTDETDEVLYFDKDGVQLNNDFSIGLNEDSIIKVQLNIQKKIDECHFSIYKWDSFCQNTLKRNLIDLLKFFDDVFDNRSVVYFDLFDSDLMFCTNTMFFKKYSQQDTTVKFNRTECIINCKRASCFYNFNEIKLLPEDFNLVIDCSQNPFLEMFDKLKTLLSLIYISDSALIEDSILKTQISGNRVIDYSVDLSGTYSSSNENLYNIYKWIYTDGNPVDKAMIARNIISLHCRFSDLLKIDEKTLLSIQSNFKIYQRENVQQYIEVKNQLANYILKTSESVSDIIIALSGNIRKNFVAVFSFLFTVVLVNIASNTPLDNIFTKDITFLVELILGGSIGYLIISVSDMNYRVGKIKEGFMAIKQNYSELLDEKEITEIFKNDKVIEGSIKEAQEKKNKYVRIWLGLIALGFIAVEYISEQPFIISLIRDLFNFIKSYIK